jgi:predicted HTH transcriptional regulator
LENYIGTDDLNDMNEIIDQIHELILEDRRISAKSIAEQLGISRERVGSIIHEDLEMLKLCSEWGSEMPERGSKTSKVSGL